MTNTDDETLLTVCIITYNHVSSIKRAIESVLMQETSFKFDILVADDASTDGTCDILRDLRERFPDRIDVRLRSVNVGAAKNWFELIDYPRSKYIAYLEGDDYWTDVQKLQVQFDVMELDESISLCFHDVFMVDTSKAYSSKFPRVNGSIFTVKDILLKSWFVPSGSIFFRANIVKSLPPDYGLVPNGDILLLYLASLQGNIKRIPRCMGIYNYLSESSMSALIGTGFNGRLKMLRNSQITTRYIFQHAPPALYPIVIAKLVKINLMISFAWLKTSWNNKW